MISFIAKTLFIVLCIIAFPIDIVRDLLSKLIWRLEYTKVCKQVSAMLGKEVTIDDVENFYKK